MDNKAGHVVMSSLAWPTAYLDADSICFCAYHVGAEGSHALLKMQRHESTLLLNCMINKSNDVSTKRSYSALRAWGSCPSTASHTHYRRRHHRARAGTGSQDAGHTLHNLRARSKCSSPRSRLGSVSTCKTSSKSFVLRSFGSLEALWRRESSLRFLDFPSISVPTSTLSSWTLHPSLSKTIPRLNVSTT